MPTCLKWHMKQNITQTAVTKALCGGLTEAVRCVSVCVSLIRPTGLNGWEEAVRDTARPALTILTSQTDRWWFSSSTEPCVCGDGPALAVEAPGERFTAGVSAPTAPHTPGHTLTTDQQNLWTETYSREKEPEKSCWETHVTTHSKHTPTAQTDSQTRVAESTSTRGLPENTPDRQQHRAKHPVSTRGTRGRHFCLSLPHVPV